MNINTTKVPDDPKNKAPSISCVIQLIMEEEDADEIQGMSILCLSLIK